MGLTECDSYRDVLHLHGWISEPTGNLNASSLRQPFDTLATPVCISYFGFSPDVAYCIIIAKSVHLIINKHHFLNQLLLFSCGEPSLSVMALR